MKAIYYQYFASNGMKPTPVHCLFIGTTYKPDFNMSMALVIISGSNKAIEIPLYDLTFETYNHES